MIYYNDNDPECTENLGKLIDAGWIPEGKIDDRSIKDVQPGDLAGFRQCHFFAGIGGWPIALALAGWPEDKEVWTASLPCQPFSTTGYRAATKDPRHLWPDFSELVNQCRPSICFGEQVAGWLGEQWLGTILDDMEKKGFAVGASNLPSASIGTNHRRQRHYWSAISNAIECRRIKLQAINKNFPFLSQGSETEQENHDPIKAGRMALAGHPWPHRSDDGISPMLYRRLITQYGNSIVPQLAALFITETIESFNDIVTVALERDRYD